jgi:hypothetical protein
MHRWERPQPRADFAQDSAEAREGYLRDRAKGTISKNKAFENNAVWSGSWSRRGQRGVHRLQLTGGLYRIKCGWCEQNVEPRGIDVEHYRPKARVSEWKGNPDIESKSPPAIVTISNDGYWWLAFQWANLTLACKDCNQTWKRNLFPVRERHPCVEGVEEREQTLLLDPASPTFQPSDHFRWALSGGIESITDEGRATIITCGLNREALREARLQKTVDIMEAVRAFNNAERDPIGEYRALVKLQEFGSATEEFTGMARWIITREIGLSSWEELGDLDLSGGPPTR